MSTGLELNEAGLLFLYPTKRCDEYLNIASGSFFYEYERPNQSINGQTNGTDYSLKPTENIEDNSMKQPVYPMVIGGIWIICLLVFIIVQIVAKKCRNGKNNIPSEI